MTRPLRRKVEPGGKDDSAQQSVQEKSAGEDRQLIERARFGDERAFERIVSKYQERTICIARSFVLDEESARDVAQEAFLRVYRSLHRYDPKHRFYTWFYRIVVHLAIDHVRRNRKPGKWMHERSALERSQRGEACDPIEKGETRSQVMSILDLVPLKYRILLVLRDIEGFTSKDISEVAGWNHATVRWRLHRARKLFREAWEEAGLPDKF